MNVVTRDKLIELGRYREQLRIIKIIENYGSKEFTSELVAIIKGEQEMTEHDPMTGDYIVGFIKGGRAADRNIKANIESRIADLRSCGKDDNCQEFAALIESYIPEWLDETAS